MSEIDLKPCPFCGDKPSILEPTRFFTDGSPSLVYHCDNCGFDLGGFRWNTRHEAAKAGDVVYPAKEWYQEIGNVMWWFFPVSEPPYCGTPLDDTWPTISGESYHTHFTLIPIPKPPAVE